MNEREKKSREKSSKVLIEVFKKLLMLLSSIQIQLGWLHDFGYKCIMSIKC